MTGILDSLAYWYFSEFVVKFPHTLFNVVYSILVEHNFSKLAVLLVFAIPKFFEYRDIFTVQKLRKEGRIGLFTSAFLLIFNTIVLTGIPAVIFLLFINLDGLILTLGSIPYVYLVALLHNYIDDSWWVDDEVYTPKTLLKELPVAILAELFLYALTDLTALFYIPMALIPVLILIRLYKGWLLVKINEYLTTLENYSKMEEPSNSGDRAVEGLGEDSEEVDELLKELMSCYEEEDSQYRRLFSAFRTS